MSCRLTALALDAYDPAGWSCTPPAASSEPALASSLVLRKRLSTRIAFVRSGLRRETWAMQQIPCCVAALAQERYATHVDTDQRTTDEVVEWIVADAGLRLEVPRLAPWRYQLRRLKVGIDHIR